MKHCLFFVVLFVWLLIWRSGGGSNVIDRLFDQEYMLLQRKDFLAPLELLWYW